MSEAQLVGDMVGAGLTARAAEDALGRQAGAQDDGHTHESACLNCGTALVGSHCHACGQPAHVHRTLSAFFHDLLHGVFHFEGRIWNTLPMLAFRPGRLTREYIDGRRASYVSPLALFLFSVFVMFAVIQSTAHDIDLGKAAESANSGPVAEGVGKGIASLQAELAKLQARRSEIAARDGDTDEVDMDIAEHVRVIAAMRRLGGEKAQSTGFEMLDSMADEVRANPKLVLYKMQSHAYKYSWALVPISVPFLWLLFPFSRRFHMYDHTVFVTYSLSFMSLLLSVYMVLAAVGAGGLNGLLAFVPPIHMYRQLRGAYGCSRLGALVRTVALLFVATFALGIFFVAIAAEAGAG